MDTQAKNIRRASKNRRSGRAVVAFQAKSRLPIPQRSPMTEGTGHEITELLQAWRGGDEQALEKLTPQIYRELHQAARRCMCRERDGHSLQATALINELYLRLSDLKEVDWQSRAHFFALCARQMRRILTDLARSRRAEKRGGGGYVLTLDEVPEISSSSHADVLAVDDALKALALIDERKSRTVELRFFGGLSLEESAEVLQVSTKTVARDWLFAKAWLLREMGGKTNES
jgi:RNA polymerase sigma-70 factor, ECF subfamily